MRTFFVSDVVMSYVIDMYNDNVDISCHVFGHKLPSYQLIHLLIVQMHNYSVDISCLRFSLAPTLYVSREIPFLGCSI
jgi:hypothetical protein